MFLNFSTMIKRNSYLQKMMKHCVAEIFKNGFRGFKKKLLNINYSGFFSTKLSERVTCLVFI
jgi:hypothetical protein